MIENCGFLEFPSVGNTMSWSGTRNKQTVKCRLDRALGNVEWHTLFPSAFVEYLGMVGSDHRPIVTNLDEKQVRTRRQFWFVRDGLVWMVLWNPFQKVGLQKGQVIIRVL